MTTAAQVTDLLTNLAGCLKTSVEAEWPSEPLAFAGVVPGDGASFDYIDEDCGGMAWVRPALFYPSTGVGVISEQPGSCGLAWSLDIEIGVVRCMEVTPEAPDPEYVAELVDRQNADMLAMVKAVACCFGIDSKDYILQPYIPLIDGNATGGIMTLIVGIL